MISTAGAVVAIILMFVVGNMDLMQVSAMIGTSGFAALVVFALCAAVARMDSAAIRSALDFSDLLDESDQKPVAGESRIRAIDMELYRENLKLRKPSK